MLAVYQHHRIHELLFHIVNFAKRSYFTQALELWDEGSDDEALPNDYFLQLSARKYQHLVDKMNSVTTPTPQREALKHQLTGLCRTLGKRYKDSLAKADLAYTAYQSVSSMPFCIKIMDSLAT